MVPLSSRLLLARRLLEVHNGFLREAAVRLHDSNECPCPIDAARLGWAKDLGKMEHLKKIDNRKEQTMVQ